MKEAIGEARNELSQLLDTLREYEKTKSRIAQLETFINTGMSLLGIDSIEEGGSETAPLALPSQEPEIKQSKLPETTLITIPLEKGIAQIIKEAGQTLRLKEIEAQFRKRNWKLSIKNGAEILRGVIRRYPENFTKKMEGNVCYYGLR